MLKHFACSGLVLLATVATAQEPATDPLELWDKVEAAGSGWGDFTATARIVSRDDKHGRITSQIKAWGLETADGGIMLKMLVTAPQGLNGLAFLIHASQQGEIDRWLYLPSTGAVREVAGTRGGGNFMGTEFTLEDIIPPDPTRFKFRYLREDEERDMTCAVTELKPRYESAAYSRLETWADREAHRLLRVDYFDEDDKPYKRLTLEDYEKVDDFWRPNKITMTNLETDYSTEMVWQTIEYGVGLTTDDFKPETLSKK